MLTGYMPPAKVVIVDDDEDDRMLLQSAFDLVAPHLPVVYLSDGTEAIHYLGNCANTPSLVLTDLNMTLIGGLELLSHIRELNLARAMPTVVLTASAADEDRQRCYQAGANAYLIKPDHLLDCIDLVRSIIRVWLADHN